MHRDPQELYQKEDICIFLNEWLDYVYAGCLARLKKEEAAWDATAAVFVRFFSAATPSVTKEDIQKRLDCIADNVATDIMRTPGYKRESPAATLQVGEAPHGLMASVRRAVLSQKNHPSGYSVFATQRFRRFVPGLCLVLLSLLIIAGTLMVDARRKKQAALAEELRYGLGGTSFDTTDFDRTREEFEKDTTRQEQGFVTDGQMYYTVPPEY